MNKPTVLECQDLCKTFTQGDLDVRVLNGVNLKIKYGERVAVMGSSGSGKSTLLHLLGGLDMPTSGKVIVDGVDLTNVSQKKLGKLRNRDLGFVYQFHHLLGEFTALENVMMPLIIGGEKIKLAEDNATDMLNRVGLGNRLIHKPGELSGGERQRAAIARALVTKPKCVLADEPTGNLDSKTADHIYQLMLTLNRELEISFLIVTHDWSLATRMDSILYLENGQLSENQELEASQPAIGESY